MKAIFATFLLLAAVLILPGCESDLPPNPKPAEGGPIRRGLSGQGKVVPLDQASDPLINETSGRVIAPSN